MNFDWTPEQALLRDSVARLAADGGGTDPEVRRRARAEPGGWPPGRWQALVLLGLVELVRPQADGGLGGAVADLVAVAEPWGAAMALEPLTELLVPAGMLAGACEAGERPALFAALAASRPLVPALFEAGARHDVHAIATRLVQGRLDGAKQAVWQGMAAGAFLVSALDGGGAPVLAVVEADAPGVERRGWRAIDGQWAAELALTGAAARVVLAGEAVTRALDAARDAVWLAASAEMLGLAGRLLEMTLAYTRERRQFGQPIGRFQVVQHRLANVYVGLEQARSLVLRAAAERGEHAATAAARAYGIEAARRASHEAVQFHGGMGVSDELVVGHGLKRLRFLMALWGDEAAARRAWRATLAAAA